ncbi:MAG: M20/M25/M40 family metallo-hydrolase [Clostridiaceae bacterium]
MNEKELLKKLTLADSPSGREHIVYPMIKEVFNEFGDVKISNLNNIYIEKKGKKDKKIMIMAHLDEVFLAVTGFSENGFLKFKPVGIDIKTLVSQEVIIHGKEDILGIINIKPPHLMSDQDKKAGVKVEDLSIDTGFSKEYIKTKVSIGDFVTLKGEFVELLNNKVSCKAIDDRAGIVSIYTMAKYLKEKDLNSNIYYVLSSQEEVGHRGSKTASYEINPDIGIAIDVTFDSGKYGADDRENIIGGGPSVCVGPNIHPKLKNIIIETAKENNIPYQIEVEPGNTGTDAWDIQVSRQGIPTLLISIPEKYMHTRVEVISMDDIINTGKLLGMFIEKLDKLDLEEVLCF